MLQGYTSKSTNRDCISTDIGVIHVSTGIMKKYKGRYVGNITTTNQRHSILSLKVANMHRTFDNIIISATHKVVPSNKSFI